VVTATDFFFTLGNRTPAAEVARAVLDTQVLGRAARLAAGGPSELVKRARVLLVPRKLHPKLTERPAAHAIPRVARRRQQGSGYSMSQPS
jgi:hypothetical protein